MKACTFLNSSTFVRCVCPVVICAVLQQPVAAGEEIAGGAVFEVVELAFVGPRQGPKDAPARDVAFSIRFRHGESGEQHVVHGFWDGDGRGGLEGSVFKVRFTPTRAGRWDLAEVASNRPELAGRRQGDYVTAAVSDHPGFWIVDDESPTRRWYRRSDGSHPYIFGNTQYSFLSGYEKGDKPSGNDIADDIEGNARYFKKLRFAPHGDIYPNPAEKPFLDDDGRPTDSGDYSHRPNPRWFYGRVDLAVQAACGKDLIADLILAGPDAETSRSTLRAANNGGDPTPYLKYIAARYGSYPNVWICLCNEYEIRKPTYSEAELAGFGKTIRTFLPYPTPLSVHSTPRTLWSAKFDSLPQWADHIIIQKKIRTLAPAADVVQEARTRKDGTIREMPLVNDELSYQGQGDKHSEQDTIESHLGVFLGGGYGTTGEKPGNKLGQYFRGKFDPSEHTAADNLAWLREQIDDHIAFWKMEPDTASFSNLPDGSRGMSWPGREYVLGTSQAHEGVIAELPEGTWTITRYDVIAKETTTLSESASGRFTFDSPDSRAVLYHFQRQ
jgi:hypothetical protein